MKYILFLILAVTIYTCRIDKGSNVSVNNEKLKYLFVRRAKQSKDTVYRKLMHHYMKKQVPNSVELIDNHLNQFFDQSDNIVVLDEIDSEIIHSDIYIIKSKKERPFTILLSCGMSALPMSVPQNTDIPKYIEIMMLLPENWKLEYKAFEDERNYWPFRILKELSKFPHENNTWLGNGHTYEHDKEFAKGVGFNSVILVNSMELSDEFTLIECEDKMVEIYTVLPLYKEELEFKKKFGKMKLLEKFDELNIEEIIQVGRKNTCE